MANPKVSSKVDLDIKITVEFPLCEARALNELCSYNTKEFLEVFYKHIGKSYLQPHEKGLIQLFETIKATMPIELRRADEFVSAINKVIETQK